MSANYSIDKPVWLARLKRQIMIADQMLVHLYEFIQKQPSDFMQGMPKSQRYEEFMHAQLHAVTAKLANLRFYAGTVAFRYIHALADHPTKVYLLDQLLDRISTDLSLFQNVISQRYSSFNTTTLNKQDLLTYMDICAMEMISPAARYIQHLAVGHPDGSVESDDALQNAGGGTAHQGYDDPTLHIDFITYFSDNLKIRQAPYYPGAVLMGVPFATSGTGLSFTSSTGEGADTVFNEGLQFGDSHLRLENALNFIESIANDSQDDGSPASPASALVPWNIVILAHEVAHYLFWHGRTADGTMTLKSKLETEVFGSMVPPKGDVILVWLEELFCDLYSVMVLGPIAVLGIQSSLLPTNPQELLQGTNTHPPRALRPVIANERMKNLRIYPEAYQALKDRWDTYLEQAIFIRSDELNIADFQKPESLGYLNVFGWMDTASTKVSNLLRNDVLTPFENDMSFGNALFSRLPWTIDQSNLDAYDDVIQLIAYWPDHGMPTQAKHENFVRDFARTDEYKTILGGNLEQIVTQLSNTLSAWGDKGNDGDATSNI